jgi:hypothetical protein
VLLLSSLQPMDTPPSETCRFDAPDSSMEPICL